MRLLESRLLFLALLAIVLCYLLSRVPVSIDKGRLTPSDPGQLGQRDDFATHYSRTPATR